MTAAGTNQGQSQGEEAPTVREARAELRRLLVGMGYEVSEQTVAALLRVLPHMLVLERDWPAGFVLARYQDGKLMRVEHKVEERIEQEAA